MTDMTDLRDPLHDIRDGHTTAEEAHESANQAAEALTSLVENTSSTQPGHTCTVHTPTAYTGQHAWLHKLIPPIEKIASKDHLGNFVTTRPPNPVQHWESMPIYVRLGMHLMFVTASSTSLMSTHYVESVLRKQSIEQGKLFDDEKGAQEHIDSFIKTYNLQDTLKDLVEPDPKKYLTFNDFFTRSLKPGMRPVDPNPDIICSAADCRLTVFESIEASTEFWVKDRKFNLHTLLEDEKIYSHPAFANGAAIMICRLAPADFHRYSAPVAGVLGPITHIPGQYYTVNPQAVNQNFPVFTANRRDVTVITYKHPTGVEHPCAFVAVGAMLVGSIVWTKREGESFEKGEELGYFAYGGSTNIAVFPKGSIKFDDDLVESSAKALESVVRCGESVGRFV